MADKDNGGGQNGRKNARKNRRADGREDGAPKGLAPFSPLAIDACALARTVGLIGDRWTLLILREIFFGVHRFDQLQHDTGAPRTILSRRLTALVEDRILVKIPYREQGRRPRHEYRLSGRGRDLMTVFVAMMEWGETYLMADRRAPVSLHDTLSGERVGVRFITASGEVISDIGRIRAHFARESPRR
ncbi:MAG TPA: helix-turn-helix domain-containing protein [Hyphomicrobiales bacterium]|nr:helix-turn-helix transcriptional regulator [Rhodobiaceae bacterium]HXK53552.1 helix-turn-helix domain-containing protein [Hyphomicrobiales bacterium]